MFLGRFWIPALKSSELPAPDSDPVALRLLGEYLVAFRDTAGQVGVLRASKANHFLQDRQAQRTKSFTGILGVREQDTAVVEGMGAKALLRGVEPIAATRGELYHPRAWSAVLPRECAEHFLEDPAVQKLMATLV